MGIKSETAEIDGLKVTTTQFAVIRQSQLLARYVRLVGPAAGVMMKAMVATGDKKMEVLVNEIMKMDVGPLLHNILSRLSADEVESLICETLAGTSVIVSIDGSQKNISLTGSGPVNDVFSGRMLTMFRAMGHALKVNYSDFSGAAASLARGVDQSLATASTSDSSSTTT